ncbi:MAG: hypothetical protein JWM59_3063 [Verrucomicrobiales bacterium]|nr:hypothetical protein [Verrucomicrobiales bacterium]
MRDAKAGKRLGKGLVADEKNRNSGVVESADSPAQTRDYQELLELLELRDEQLEQAHASLELSQHRHADLYNFAPVGYITLDNRACIREINHRAAELLGFAQAYLIGRPIVPYLAQADRRAFLKHLWQCRHSRDEHTVTLRLNTGDRGERWVEFITRPAHEFENKSGWCHTALVDVTERRTTEAALMASEARFRLLAENMGEVFWFMELDPPRVTYVSPAFEEIWGIPATDLYADNQVWMNAIHPDDRETVRTAFYRWITDEAPAFRMEYRVLSREGRMHWITDRGIVMGRKDGRPHHISGLARDISERKKAEALSRQLAAVVESSEDAIITKTLDGIITTWNFGAQRLFGYSAAEAVGKPVAFLIPPDAWEAEVALMDHIRRGERVAPCETRRRCREGRILEVSLTISPLRDSAGRIIGVSSISRDITSRKLGEQKFRGLLESAPDAMVVVNGSGVVELINAQAMTLFGYSRDELIGQPMEMLLPERFRGRHPDHQVTYNASPHTRPMGVGMTLLARRKDGGEFPVEVSLSPLETAEGKLVISAVRDITQQKKAEEALRASEERLRLFILHTPAPVVMFDREMRYIVASDRWVEDFRLNVSDLTGRSHYEIFPEIPESWKIIHQRCLAGATESCERDPFPRADGSLDWIKWECRPWHDSRGEIGGIILFAEIINDRVRFENEITYARRFAKSTLEAVPASLAVLNPEGIIVRTNQAWREFASQNGGSGSVMGEGADYLSVCDAAAGSGDKESAVFATGIRDVIAGRRARFSMEYACHSPDEKRWFVGYATPFQDGIPHSVVIAHVDISERKRAEEMIRKLNEKLEDRVARRTAKLRIANEDLKDEIVKRRELEQEISNISDLERQRIGQELHDDLGQQIAGISLLTGVLKRNLADKNSCEAGLADELLRLLKDALALTRALAHGLQPVVLEKGGFDSALKELSERTSNMFRIQCRSHCPVDLTLDNKMATHLYRIAQEAITNAVKHGAASKIEIGISVTPRWTKMSIQDNGGRDATPHAKGTKGMGLRIMGYRADLIGGTLEFSHPPDGGTLVVCTFPASTPK